MPNFCSMTRTPSRRTVALTLVTIATAGVLAACGSSEEAVPPTPMPMMSSAAPSASIDSRAADIMFAQVMIPHHQQAIEMSDMALSQASSNDIKDLADQMKSEQAPEIAVMRGWLANWGAPETPVDDLSNHSTGTGMMTADDMSALSALNGPDFDRLWLQMMISHHQGAIKMAKDVLATTNDPEVKALAQSIIDAQTKEIASIEVLQANGE
jgi:uncharacterized protein (DUF305 family)